MDQIQIKNFSSFFHRELMLYSFGDISLKKPIPLKKAMYILGAAAIWTLPIYLISGGFQFTPVWVAIACVPPFAFGHFASKNIFCGKSLIDHCKATFKFIVNPKCWTDGVGSNDLDKGVFEIDHSIWISRRRELQIVASMRRERPVKLFREVVTVHDPTPAYSGSEPLFIGEKYIKSVCQECGIHENALKAQRRASYVDGMGFLVCDKCLEKFA